MDNRSKQILIADDDAGIRLLLRRVVKDSGGRVVYSAESVEDIVNNESIDYGEIDIAIVDYKFEGYRTGIDLANYLKDRGVKRIYLCTGYFDDENVIKSAQKAGIDCIIPKPLDEAKLTNLLS